MRQGIFHRIYRIEIGEIHISRFAGSLVLVYDILLHRRAAENDIPFLLRQLPEGHIRTDTHLPGNVLHERPHERLPRKDSAFINGQAFIGNQRGFIHRADQTGPAAGSAGTAGIEGQILCPGPVKMRAAHRTDDFLHKRHRHGGLHIVAVRTAVAPQPGKEEAQTVQQLRGRTEGRPDAGNARTLMQRQCGRHIADLLRIGLFRLGHSPPRIGGKRLQVPPGALRIKHPQRQRRLPRAGHPRHSGELSQRDIHINVLQIMHPCAPHLDAGRLSPGTFHTASFRIPSVSFIVPLPENAEECVKKESSVRFSLSAEKPDISAPF